MHEIDHTARVNDIKNGIVEGEGTFVLSVAVVFFSICKKLDLYT